MDRITLEELDVLRFLESCQNKKLRERIFEHNNPTLTEVCTIVAMYMKQRKNEQTIAARAPAASAESVASVQNNSTQNNVQRKNSVQNKKKRNKSGKCPPWMADLNNRCWGCGQESHGSKAEREKSCKAKDAICGHCKIKGHFQNCCYTKRKAEQDGTASSRGDVRQVQDESHEDTYEVRISAQISNDKGDAFTFRVFADTGAVCSLISADLAETHHIQPHMQAVNGQQLEVLGTASVSIQCGNHKITSDIIITTSMHNEIILGLGDLHKLSIVHERFPMPIYSTKESRSESIAKMKEHFINKYPQVLTDKLLETPMVGGDMKVTIKGNPDPYKVVTARQVPLRFQQKAEQCVQKMIEERIIAIETGHTPWCAPGFFVIKGNGEVRPVVDYTQLNKHVARDAHLFTPSKDIVAGIDPGAKYFAKFDLKSGYHQISLDEESSKLTTFLLFNGQYRYLRAPMGLCSSSDEFCRRTDEALAGLPIRKLVDDILITASTLGDLQTKIDMLLQRCHSHNIVLSKPKFQIAEEISFAGYTINANGVEPSPDKLQAIRAFPTPSRVEEVRTFLGMVNRLSPFISDTAQLTDPIRQLLKKETLWHWGPDQDKSFRDIKAALHDLLILNHFDPALQTFLYTDASKLNGIGFVMIQRTANNEDRVIQCGSRSLTSSERNYAAMEIEALAIAYAIKKCDLFLRGFPFTVVTDHKPLIGLWNKPLSQIDNQRILRYRMATQEYQCHVTWTPGKYNRLADIFSHHTDHGSDNVDNNVFSCRLATGPNATKLRDAAARCPQYQSILVAVREGIKHKDLPPKHPGRTLSSIWDSLSVSEDNLVVHDTNQILVPTEARHAIIERLHKSHCGISKTLNTARAAFIWPSMRRDIKEYVDQCTKCQMMRQSNPEEQVHRPSSATRPMEFIGTDLFQAKGNHYLVACDLYSNYPFVAKISSLNSSAIIAHMKRWFQIFGYPDTCRTDFGPQFRSEFGEFCKKHGISHEVSSPYFPRSNGLAESCVKSIKHLVLKSTTDIEFQEALSYWKNTRKADNPSPNELFLGRQIKLDLPTTIDLISPSNVQRNAVMTPQISKRLRSLHISQPVWVQDREKRWTVRGTVVSASKRGDYIVLTDDDVEIRRNRAFIRPRYAN